MTISGKLLPKHQRLILACYPPGRGVDKRPNASELSYLFYYVTTRRMKLVKVASFLEKSVNSEVAHSRYGNVRVSLEIVNGLIEKCNENLGLFAGCVVSILNRVLQSKDLPLCQQAVQVFSTLCRYHDQTLFISDARYVDHFNNLALNFIKFGYHDINYEKLQWVDLSTEASKALARSVLISTRAGQQLLAEMIPALLHVLVFGKSAESLLQVKRYASDNKDEFEAITSTVEGIDSNSTDIVKRERLARTKNQIGALNALRYVFDCSSAIQILKATRECISFVMKENAPLDWSTSLVEMAARWAPLQLRFEIISTVVDALVNLPLEPTPQKVLVANITSSLLCSSVNMIGLSVMDILRALLTNQHDTIRSSSQNTESEDMVVSLRKCIANLAAHIYYGDQVTDMVSEIMNRCLHRSEILDRDESKTSSADNGTSSLDDRRHHRYRLSSRRSNLHNGISEQPSLRNFCQDTSSSMRDSILVNDLKNINEILLIASDTEHRADNTDIPLRLWNHSEIVLSSENWNVRLAFISALIQYLNGTIGEEDKTIANMTSTFRPEHGTLGRLVRAITKKVMSPSTHKSDYIACYHLLVKIVTCLGVNGMARAIPFSLLIQDLGCNIEHGTSSKDFFLEQGVALSSMSLGILYAVAHQAKAENAQAKILAAINNRKEKGLWYTVLDVPITKGLTEDLEEKPKLPIGPFDPQMAAECIPVNREGLASTLNLTECTSEVNQVIFGAITDFDELPNSENESSHEQETMARATSAPWSPLAGISLSYAATIHSDRSDSERDNSIFQHRQFSPRIRDLKKAAVSSHRLKERRIPSSRSNLTIRAVLDEGTTQKKDDIESFLNSLNLSKE